MSDQNDQGPKIAYIYIVATQLRISHGNFQQDLGLCGFQMLNHIDSSCIKVSILDFLKGTIEAS